MKRGGNKNKLQQQNPYKTLDSKATINDTKVDDTFNDYEYHKQIPMPQI